MTDHELDNLHDGGDGTHVTEELYLEAKRARAREFILAEMTKDLNRRLEIALRHLSTIQKTVDHARLEGVLT